MGAGPAGRRISGEFRSVIRSAYGVPVDGAVEDPTRAQRDRLTDGLLASAAVQNPAVAAAFRAVPRHVFLPGVAVELAYSDEAVPTKWAPDGRPVSSSSQPAIMAIMLEQLGVAPGQRVLEIGAGTGYNAALLSYLVGATGHVTTVDIDHDVVAQARARLAEAGFAGVTVVCADGAFGWPPAAPFDRIIVTAGAWELAPAWRDQLAPAGRIVLPLSIRGVQLSVAFERAASGRGGAESTLKRPESGHAPVADTMVSVSVASCGFMPLRGSLAEPGGPRVLGDRPGLFVYVDDDRPLDTGRLFAALTPLDDPAPAVSTGVRVDTPDLWGGVDLWLALHAPEAGALSAIGPAVELGLVPDLITYPGQVRTMGLVTKAALAMLTREDAGDTFTLGVRGYGAGGTELAERLAAHVRAWHAAGRPTAQGLRIRAHRPEAEVTGVVVHKRHGRLELDWP